MEWTTDAKKKVPVALLRPGYKWKVFGLFETNRHLIVPVDPNQRIFLLGSDRLGRDQWSRIMHGTQTSMTVGLVAVALSVILGVVLGGISGYVGGKTDQVIQRLIELLQSVPTIPIWLALSAALPRDWTPIQIFFAITVILSLVGWTTLGREVRGRFLALREEDFVLAARLAGCSRMRIILRHMVPTFLSHIIATSSLAIPVMIINETSLSFLGLGIRPPAISWGVLLQEAQNIQTLALAPWLLIPGLVVIVAVLAFNLVGDGLRDAADPVQPLRRRERRRPTAALACATSASPSPSTKAWCAPSTAPASTSCPARCWASSAKAAAARASPCGRSCSSSTRPGRITEGEIRFRRDDDGGSSISRSCRRAAREMRDIRGGEIALIPQEPMAAFSPVHTVGDQIVEAILLHAIAGDGRPQAQPQRGARHHGRPVPRRRHLDARAAHRRLFLAALGRPAPARHDRHGAQLQAAPADRRRADDGDRRHHPGAGAGAAARPAGASYNTAIIFITHDLGVIAQMASYVVVMYLGRVMEEGPVDDIFHAPKHPYTRALLRSIPSLYGETRVALPVISGALPHPFNRPPGCPFHPRCPDVMPRCSAAVPRLHAGRHQPARELLPASRGGGATT